MIIVNFTSPISDARRDIFLQSAIRWNSVVRTDFEPVIVDGARVEGIVIDASVTPIDGEAGVLGRAGPTILRVGSELPVKGVMEFDTADVEKLEREGSFADVIMHEMAHVLGFGTLWARLGLLQSSGTNNPRFSGANAIREYARLVEAAPGSTFEPVPVANTGGAGTREGHWRELVFGDELLTGFLSGSERPLSRMSIGAFEDMGYEVDYSTADPYRLPTFRDLAVMGITEAVRICDLCRMGRPEPVVLGS